MCTTDRQEPPASAAATRSPRIIQRRRRADGRSLLSGKTSMRQFDATSEGLRDGDSDVRRRRLLFRCWHNGTQEADLLLGSFAEASLASFDSNQLDRFEGLLD